MPANSPRKLEKAPTLGADALILDLEDAVPTASKSVAREIAGRWVAAQSTDIPVWVRVNNEGGELEADLRTFVTARIRGVVVPKLESAPAAARISALIAEIEAERALEPGSVLIVPMVENAHAVLTAFDIARVDRVLTLMMGQYDLAAELGVRLSSVDTLQTARAMLVLACAAAGRCGPVAPVEADIRNSETFRQSTSYLRDEGHSGRAVVHPAQIGPANDVFSPTPDELDAIRRMAKTLRDADAEGSGVALDEHGNLVDKATLRLAERYVLQEPGSS